MAYSESNYFNIKVILFVLTLTFLPVYSHALKADSLKAILVEYYHNDTTRVNLLSQIATAYKDVNNDSMRVAALKGLELARKINFEKGKGECLMLVGLASLNAGQNDKAVTTYQEAIACFEKVGNKKAVATATGNIALIYYRTRKTDDAMTWFKKMGDIASAAHDDENYAMSLVRTGYMYSDKGNYSEALSYALRGLSVYERLNDKTNIAACYRDIADVYSLTGDTLRTKEYINKCLATSVGFKDLQARIANYTAVGSIFGRLQDAENALISFNIGYTLADSINNHYWKNVCLINQGEVYMQLRKYEEARSKFTAALKESIIADDSVGMAYNYSGVGGTLLFTGHLREAIEQLLKAYGITSRKGLLHQSFVSASDIGEAYEKLKDYKHALEFMKIARSIKDSMFNEQSDKKIQQLQFEYELGKKQNQIELLNKNKLIERSGREKQTVVMWGLIAVLLLFVAIVVLLYRSRRKEIRNKELILRQKEVLRLQAEKLSELNEFKDRTFSVLAHDLRGPLAAFTTTMQMLDENVITHDEFTELKPAVDKQLNSLNVLLDNLLKWSKSYIMGEIATQPVNVAVYAITAANIGLVQDAADKKKIRIINNIPVDITAFADEGQVDIVIRNLISNAIKFTREEGTVTLAAGKKADRTIITVTDNGVGMTEEQLKKLFTTSPDNTTYGTKGERGIGLGLLLCHEFIKANNGTIVVVSEAGKGTVFTIDLPGNS